MRVHITIQKPGGTKEAGLQDMVWNVIAMDGAFRMELSAAMKGRNWKTKLRAADEAVAFRECDENGLH